MPQMAPVDTISSVNPPYQIDKGATKPKKTNPKSEPRPEDVAAGAPKSSGASPSLSIPGSKSKAGGSGEQHSSSATVSNGAAEVAHKPRKSKSTATKQSPQEALTAQNGQVDLPAGRQPGLQQALPQQMQQQQPPRQERRKKQQQQQQLQLQQRQRYLQQQQQQQQQLAAPLSAACMPEAIDRVAVPPELAEWASNGGGADDFQSILSAVRQKSGVYWLRVEAADDGSFWIAVAAPGPAEANVARVLLSAHMTNQLDLLRIEARSQARRQDVNSLHQQVVSGLRITFAIAEAHVGLMIGRGGARINRVQEATGCQVHVDNGGRVSIAGPSPEAVRAARDACEFVEERVPVQPRHAAVLHRRSEKLRGIGQDSDCCVVRLDHHNQLAATPAASQGGPEAAGGSGTGGASVCVVLIGDRTAVATAKMLLEVSLGYLEKEAAMMESDAEMRGRLEALRIDYGGGYRGRNGGGAHGQGSQGGGGGQGSQGGGADGARARRDGDSNRGGSGGGSSGGNGGGGARSENGVEGGDGGGGSAVNPRNLSARELWTAEHRQGGARSGSGSRPASRPGSQENGQAASGTELRRDGVAQASQQLPPPLPQQGQKQEQSRIRVRPKDRQQLRQQQQQGVQQAPQQQQNRQQQQKLAKPALLLSPQEQPQVAAAQHQPAPQPAQQQAPLPQQVQRAQKQAPPPPQRLQQDPPEHATNCDASTRQNGDSGTMQRSRRSRRRAEP